MTTDKGGRRALAPEVHERNGTYKIHPERRNPDAPKANGQTPEMPSYFDEMESAKWHELIADLDLMGILSSECRELLIAYCTAYSGWMRAREKVATVGLAIVQKGKNGEVKIKRNPFSAELHKYRDEMNRLLPEFGLTPSSRGRLKSFKDQSTENPLGSILERMGSIN